VRLSGLVVALLLLVSPAFFRRRIDFRRVFEFRRFPRRLFRWIEFGEFLVERSFEQSRFRRLVFSQLQCEIRRTTPDRE
jgi:hypothetical protein